MTNYEKFISMTEEELAEKLYFDFLPDCYNCPCDELNYKECFSNDCDCIALITKWLKSKLNGKV